MEHPRRGESDPMGKTVIFSKKDLLWLDYFVGIYLSHPYDAVLDALNAATGVYKSQAEYAFLRIKLNKKSPGRLILIPIGCCYNYSEITLSSSLQLLKACIDQLVEELQVARDAWKRVKTCW